VVRSGGFFVNIMSCFCRPARFLKSAAGVRRLLAIPLLLFPWISTGALQSPAAAQPAASTAPARDSCILELDVPIDALVTIDGRDYGLKRRLSFSGLQPGRDYRSKVRITLAGGKVEERTVTISGGQTVRVSIAQETTPVSRRSEAFQRLFEFRDPSPKSATAGSKQPGTPSATRHDHLAVGSGDEKPWTEAEKVIAGELLDAALSRAPGLFERAAAGRKIQLVRQTDFAGATAVARPAERVLVICDKAFERGKELSIEGRALLITQTLIHETVHLADRHLRVAWGPEWTAMVGSRLERIHRRYAAATGVPLRQAWATKKCDDDLLQKLATEEGVLLAYAAVDQEEALSELASLAAMFKIGDRKTDKIPAEILALINDQLLAPAGTPSELDVQLDVAAAALSPLSQFWSIMAADAALALSPKLPAALRHRALALRHLGRLDESIAAYDTVVELIPPFGNGFFVYAERAQAWSDQGNPQRALADRNSAVDHAVQPFERSGSLLQRAILYGSQGAVDSALADVEECARLDHDSIAVIMLRAELLLVRHDYDRAITEFDKAIKAADTASLPALLRDRAKAWIGKGDAERALQDIEEAIRKDPELWDAYVLRAQLQSERRQPFPAIQDLDLVIQKEPGLARPWLLRGGIWFRLLNTDRAIADLTEGLKRDPTVADAYKMRAIAYIMKNKKTEAIADLTEFIRYQPNESIGYLMRGDLLQSLGRHDEAITDYTELIRRTADDATLQSLRSSAFVGRARSLSEKESYDQARADFNQAIAVAPESAPARFARGRYLWSRALRGGETEGLPQAIDDLKEAIRLNAKDAEYYDVLASVLTTAGNPAEAIANRDKYIELKPKDPNGYHARGVTWYRQSNFARAISDFDQAIKLSPTFANAYYMRGICRFMGQSDTNGGIADLDKAIQYDADASYYSMRGLMRIEKDDADGAIADCTRALELNPKYSAAYENRGTAHALKRSYREALVDFDHALEHNSNNAGALGGKARLLAAAPDDSLRDGALALKLATKACELTNHQDHALLETLAMASAETGDFEQAVKWQDAAIKVLETRSKDGDQYHKRRELYVSKTPYRL
jgi:tetratricopeptide (TPR) repeat protein